MHRLIALFAAAVVVLGCGNPTPSATPFSDPREVLLRTIAVTATIRTAHIRIDVETGNQNVGPGANAVEGGFVEGDFDLVTGELAARGGGRDGGGAFAMIRTRDATFVQNTDSNVGNVDPARWTRLPGTGMDPLTFLFMAGPRTGHGEPIPQLLAAVATDARTRLELRGLEDCPTRRCYRTAVDVGPDQLWALVVKVSGMDAMPEDGPVPERPADFPGIRLEVLTDFETLRLVELVGVADPPHATISLRVKVSNPNMPVSIQPPPAHLVDDALG